MWSEHEWLQTAQTHELNRVQRPAIGRQGTEADGLEAAACVRAGQARITGREGEGDCGCGLSFFFQFDPTD